MMPVAPRLRPGDPLGFSIRQSSSAVQGRGHLQTYPGAAARHARDEADVELARLRLHQPVLERDARGREGLSSLQRLGIRVAHRRDDALHLALNQLLDARRRTPLMIARLEADVNRRAGRRGFSQRDHFGVRAAGALVPSLAHNSGVFCHYTTHPGIRRSGVHALLRQLERAPHHGAVELGERHYLRRFLPAFTSCTASRKSSGVSKLRYTEAKRMYAILSSLASSRITKSPTRVVGTSRSPSARRRSITRSTASSTSSVDTGRLRSASIMLPSSLSRSKSLRLPSFFTRRGIFRSTRS